MSSFDLDPVDTFAAGAVGEPGQRVFYLQVSAGGESPVSFRLEKTQVAALAGYLAQLLSDLPTPAPGDEPQATALVEPVVPEWVVGQIAVAYDERAGTFLVRFDELTLDDEDDEDDEEGGAGTDTLPGTARVTLTRGQAHAFVEQAAELVAAGRPACPLCGRPVDPEGHLCPKTNGHSH
jgi:uncharacterized repeat protein (TIGR03847 family)